MLQVALKIVITAILVVGIAELAKRSTFLGAVLASIPLTSVLAMAWLYADTGDTQKVADLASGIFWLVLPSLALFIALPLMLRAGWPFIPSPCRLLRHYGGLLFRDDRASATVRHPVLSDRVTGRAQPANCSGPCCTSTT